MDPIIGDFTLTSVRSKRQDPAVITTTFSRAIKQEEGYEIALKSICHAPVKNLLQENIVLVKQNKEHVKTNYVLNLTSRFYESQADILMEIHRLIIDLSLIDPPIMSFYEKNGEMTLRFLESGSDYFLHLKTDFFLNRTFKYKNVTNEKESTPANLKRKREITSRQAKEINRRLHTQEQHVAELQSIMNRMEMFYKYLNIGKVNKALEEWLAAHEDMQTRLTNVEQLKGMMEVIKAKIEKLENPAITLYSQDGPSEGQIETMTREIVEIKTILQELGINKQDLDKHIEESKVVKRHVETHLGTLARKVDSNTNVLSKQMHLFSQMFKVDDKQSIAVDTSNFVTAKIKKEIDVVELTVSADTISTTRLAMIYCDIVENSLLDNEQSRLLTTIPIVSNRGYNFYEFKKPIYKPISILQFSTIEFHILDQENELMGFSLLGDEMTNNQKANRKYPTILNLHIRKRV